MEEKKNNKTIIGIVIGLVVAVIAFFLGYWLKEEGKCIHDCPYQECEKNEQENKTDTTAIDNIVVNLYGGGYIYFISNDSLYYLEAENLSDGRWFLLTFYPCLANDSNYTDYCNGNPVYKKVPVKVEGIDNVLKVRLLPRPGATDESFSTFAVDEAGNVYKIDGNKASKYYGNNDVADIIDVNKVVLKDGTTQTIN